MMEQHIRIVIADAQTLLREGLVERLNREADLQVVGEAANRFEVMKAVTATHPDVLLLDLSLPEMNRLPALQHLRTASPLTQVIALIDTFDQELVFSVLCQGVQGYLLKSESSLNLVKAIRCVHAGEAWIERNIMSRLIQAFPNASQQDDLSKRISRDHLLLSPRETEISECVAAGFSNREIAHQLCISEATVKSHLVNIFRKLNIRDRVQLTLHALGRDAFLQGQWHANDHPLR